MTETGRVAALVGDRAEVEIETGGACDRCGAAALCRWTGQGRKLLTVRNPIGAGVGDSVLVETPEQGRSLSALLVFGLPVLLMAAGVLAGSLVWGNAGAAILAGAGLGLAVAALKIVDATLRRSGRRLPRIVEKVGAPACPEGQPAGRVDDSG